MAKKKEPDKKNEVDAELISILEEDVEEPKSNDAPPTAVTPPPPPEIDDEPDDDLPDDEPDDLPDEPDESDEPDEPEQMLDELVDEPSVDLSEAAEVVEPTLSVPVERVLPAPNQDGTIQPAQDDVGIKKLVKKFGDSVDVIISNHKLDRDQVEDAIKLIEKKIKDAVDNGARIQTGYLDIYARLLQTKADINSTAPKVLDSVAKLIAAGKGNDLIINLGVAASGKLDLEALLEQPEYEDETSDADGKDGN